VPEGGFCCHLSTNDPKDSVVYSNPRRPIPLRTPVQPRKRPHRRLAPLIPPTIPGSGPNSPTDERGRSAPRDGEDETGSQTEAAMPSSLHNSSSSLAEGPANSMDSETASLHSSVGPVQSSTLAPVRRRTRRSTSQSSGYVRAPAEVDNRRASVYVMANSIADETMARTGINLSLAEGITLNHTIPTTTKEAGLRHVRTGSSSSITSSGPSLPGSPEKRPSTSASMEIRQQKPEKAEKQGILSSVASFFKAPKQFYRTNNTLSVSGNLNPAASGSYLGIPTSSNSSASSVAATATRQLTAAEIDEKLETYFVGFAYLRS